MNEEYFESQLSEARKKIDALPEDQRGPLLDLLEETRTRHTNIKQNITKLKDAVGEMQLMVKYLIFDRDVTRRERDDLRRKLNEDRTQ